MKSVRAGAMKSVWRALWLLCLSACVCKRVCVRATQGEDIPEDNGLLRLNKGNFDQALKLYQPLLVQFYAPLSGESMGSIMEFSRAAAQLKDAHAAITLAAVDMSKEKALAAELNVTVIPSIRLYLSADRHNPIICPALRDAEAILTWLKRREGPSADVIKALSQLKDFSKSHDLAVLGLFRDLEQGAVQVFFSVAAEVPDLPFAVTHSSEVFTHYSIHTDSVLILRKDNLDSKLEMSSDITKDDLTDFIRIYEFDLVTEYNGKTGPQILNSVLKNHLVLFINKTEEISTHTLTEFHKTATLFRGQVLCVLIDMEEPRNGRVIEFFRVRFEDAPLVRMVNMTDGQQYQLHTHTVDTHTLTHFTREYLQGNAKPRLQSEPIPADWDQQPVKELVGQNFEAVVFNEKNNVLVLFYAPWSEESRALFPLWEEIAHRFRNHDNMVIARIDTTANDVNIRMTERPPSIKIFPAVYAQRVISYTGDPTADALVEFVQQEVKRAKKDKAKEEKERKKYIETVKAAEAAEVPDF
ncbi:protein disulfide-isomerase [Clupea harengus]|uniref:protein disulfide-isomerase n=1 Tax=Clupea harengus TaxID=7950 RepID=A0A6P8F5R4_CLUHA|nr:protein disulfide-isomerase [Clupea harengus]